MAQPRASTSVQINGPALRVIRQLVGVSCSVLAREVGTDVSFLARVERGEKRGVRPETFERLVAVLGVDRRALMAHPYAGVSAVTVAHMAPRATSGLHSRCTTCTTAA